MKFIKNENKNLSSKSEIKKINLSPIKTKKSSLKYNLFFFVFIISFLIISLQMIFPKIKMLLAKEDNQKIYLRSTESNDYNIDKSKTIEENGKKIYSKNGNININKLENLYNGNNEPDTSKFNHIHIALCVNEDYHLLASVTIASILKNANSVSYIHLHIIALNNLEFKTMNKIYSLKSKINNNAEFIFYNGKRSKKISIWESKLVKGEQLTMGDYLLLN